jgi:hypothetical protein
LNSVLRDLHGDGSCFCRGHAVGASLVLFLCLFVSRAKILIIDLFARQLDP